MRFADHHHVHHLHGLTGREIAARVRMFA